MIGVDITSHHSTNVFFIALHFSRCNLKSNLEIFFLSKMNIFECQLKVDSIKLK
jgi:hypothetical protein